MSSAQSSMAAPRQATRGRVAFQHEWFHMSVGHLLLEKLPHFVVAHFAQEPSFHTELAQAAHGVGRRTARGSLATKLIIHHFGDFQCGWNINVGHAAFGKAHFLKDVFVGNLGDEIDQGAPDAEYFFHWVGIQRFKIQYSKFAQRYEKIDSLRQIKNFILIINQI